MSLISKSKIRSIAVFYLNGKRQEVQADQVNLSSSEGDMGILANHVPSLIQLRPGLLEIFTDGSASQSGSKRSAFFVSGGFATVNPDSSMQIAAFEAVTLDKIDPEVRFSEHVSSY